MTMYDIIQKKRDGFPLSDNEIKFFVDGFTSGEIPDYQASALLMAIYFKGMDERETVTLTECMRDSGQKADLSALENTVDKHSTGGVGDKTTLVVAPIVACLGCTVAKMSGKGLGHTGGTVDKLASIDGYKTELQPQEFVRISREIGVCVVGQTGNFAPADKKLYSLRDVTATVDNISLIASSIMSKKLAAGSDVIVLDVKTGSGAFMQTLEQSVALAECMVSIGKMSGKKTAALITDMDKPLGRNIGNALEVKEAIEVLKHGKPSDLKEICIALSSLIVSLSKNISIDKAKQQVVDVLQTGKAYEKFLEWISSQGGNIKLFDDIENFCKPKFCFSIKSKTDGYISKIDAQQIGKVALVLGAGRQKKEDEIDYSAGLVLNKTFGDKVCLGEEIACLYSSVVSDFTNATEMFEGAITFSDTKPKVTPIVIKTII